MHQGGFEPPCPIRDYGFTGRCLTTSASDARLFETKTSRKNLMKAGRPARLRDVLYEREAVGSPPSSLKVIRLSNSKRKGAGPLASHRKQARSLQVSAKRLEIWGAGGPPPLKLSLYLAIIATQPAFESEGVALRNPSTGLRR